MGVKAAAKEQFQTDSLKGVRIAVQGLGNVGSNLVRHLVEEGALVTITDLDQERVKRMVDQYKVQSCHPDEILFMDCDILSPNALGGIINDNTIEKLRCKVVAGGANNQLMEPRHGDALKARGILYAPDYVVNAGGLMNVFVELEGYSPERALEKTKRVYDNVLKVFQLAKRDNIGTHTAADRFAEERIKTIGNLKQRHPGKSSRAFSTLREINNR